MTTTKISISGDIHLNLRSANESYIDWERDRFIALFNTLASDDSDTVVLSGDIFDKAKPTFQEIGLLYEGIELLSDKVVYIIDGNHEELSDTTTTFDYLPQAGYTRIKADVLTFDSTYIWLVGHPHIDLITKDLLPIMYDKKNILISHYRSDIGYAKEEVDNELVSRRFDDTILSDIHYRLTPADNIQYTSSPYGIHFTPDKDYGYCTLEISNDGYNIEFVKLSLPSKIKITTTVADLPDTLQQLDPTNLYNLEISGSSTSETLMLIGDTPCVSKFIFSELVVDDMEEIADDLKAAGDNSISEIIMVALDDVELSEEELLRAEQILKEVL